MEKQGPGLWPERTADTMSMAIAMSSPSGRMSKRFKAACGKKLAAALFGTPEEQAARLREYESRPRTKEERSRPLLRRAALLRELASGGMGVRKHTKEAERLEAKARDIERA